MKTPHTKGSVRVVINRVPGETGTFVLREHLREFYNEIIERTRWFSPAQQKQVRMERGLHVVWQVESEGFVSLRSGGGEARPRTD